VTGEPVVATVVEVTWSPKDQVDVAAVPSALMEPAELNETVRLPGVTVEVKSAVGGSALGLVSLPPQPANNVAATIVSRKNDTAFLTTCIQRSKSLLQMRDVATLLAFYPV